MIPLVTVIIPCFNAENYLSDTINSLLNQTYNNYEILIFDDGSTDYSLDICNKYASNCDIITVFHRKNNREVGFNKGIACTLNDLISFRLVNISFEVTPMIFLIPAVLSSLLIML